jgi:hypothetical protein
MYVIIMEWILGRLTGNGVDSVGSELRKVAGCFECGDEPSGTSVTELVTE